MLQFRCGKCGQKMGVPEAYAGKRVRCPRCQEPARVPLEDRPAPSAPEPQPIFESRHDDVSSTFADASPDFGATGEHSPGPAFGRASEPEVLDAPERPAEPLPDSSQEVAALLRELAPEEQAADYPPVSSPPPDGSVQLPRPGNAHEEPAPTTSLATLLGMISFLLGIGAIGFCWQPPLVRFALPIGAAGAGLGIVAIIVSLLRRGAGLGVALVGVLVSCAASAFIVLGTRGLVPARYVPASLRAGSRPVMAGRAPVSSESSTPDAAHDTPATIAPARIGDVEVRVASALVLRPSVYDGDFNSLHTAAARYLQVTLELRHVGESQVAEYRSWGKPAADETFASLTDARGTSLKLIDLSPLMPVGRVKGPTALFPRGPALSDVLLFEPPASNGADLTLELPGGNVGAPGQSVRIRIPANSIRSQ